MNYNKLTPAEEFNLQQLIKNMREYEQKTTHSKQSKYHLYPPYYCKCIFCVEQDDIKKSQPSGDYSLLSDIENLPKADHEHIQHIKNEPIIQTQGEFATLITKLIPNGQYMRPPLIYIQDTVFYMNKEGYMMVYNQTDETNLTFIQNKDKLTQFSLIQFFAKRRSDFETKVKLEERQQSGQIFSQMDKGSMEALRKIKQSMSLSAPDKQYAHIFYNTEDSNQIVSQPDFNFFMERRKNDNVWGKIHFIQSCSIDKIKIFEVRYWYDEEFETGLFKMAKEDVTNYLNLQNYWHSKIYEKEKYLLKEMIKDRNIYLKYISYKACVYAEIVNNCRIKVYFQKISQIFTNKKRCIFQYAKSPQNQYYLINCKQLCILDVQGIRHANFFKRYVKNYSVQEQNEIIAEFENMKKQIEMDEQMKTKQRQLKYSQQKDKQIKDQSGKHIVMGEFIKEETDYLINKYATKINEQYDQFDKIEEKIISRKMFKQVNQLAEGHDFYDLLSIGNDQNESYQELLRKQLLFSNFPVEKKRFVKELEYKQYQKNLQENKKNQKSKLFEFSEIQRPMTAVNVKQQTLKDCFSNVNKKEGGKLTISHKQSPSLSINPPSSSKHHYQSQQQTLSQTQNQSRNQTIFSQNEGDDQNQNQCKTFKSHHRKFKSESQFSAKQLQNEYIDKIKVKKTSLQMTPDVFRSPNQNNSRKSISTTNTPLQKQLISPASHLIKSKCIRGLMGDQSPLLYLFKNSQFQQQHEYVRMLPQLFSIKKENMY